MGKPDKIPSWFERVIGPHASIVSYEKRHTARLFSLMMLTHMLMALFGYWISDLAFRKILKSNMLFGNESLIVAIGFFLVALSFFLLRRGYFYPGIWLYIFATAVVALISPFINITNPEITLISLTIVPVLLAAMVFDSRVLLRVILIVIGSGTLSLVLLPLDARAFVSGVVLLVIVLLVSFLVLVFKYHLGRLERERIQNLKTSENNYRNLFETVVDGIFIVSANGKLLEVNQAACSQLGYSREELLAMSLDEMVGRPPGSWQTTAQTVRRLGLMQRESQHRHRDGRSIPVELQVSATTYNGQAAFLGVARDISSRIQMEAEKKKLEIQLQQAVKMESLGKMAGGVAHDFNNLLTAILGHVDFTELQPNDPMVLQNSLREIRKAASSAAALTRGLLAFSRKQIIEPKVIDLNLLINRMQNLLSRLLGEDIKLTTELTPELWRVKVDPGFVEQVVVNLAVNARDAMPHGGQMEIKTANVVLDSDYVALHPLTKPGRYVLIELSDTGQGMSDETKKHIFEPFYSTKPTGQGTGLGLATTYGVIQQSQGSIEVYSELGHGTTFRIYLPSIDEPVDSNSEHREVPTIRHGSETILLVEDQPLVRDFAKKLLKTLGYQVLSAKDAEQALLLAKSHTEPIDLLLTDVILPGKNGRQLADELKSSHPETKVLFVSGYSPNIIAHHGVLDPGVELVQKPYSAADIATKIRFILDR